jgi:hypothetical protein
MKWSKSIRQFHRGLSIIFTLMVLANLLVQGREPTALYVGVATLVPLLLLMVTGLYMFALPYLARRREARATAQEGS